MWVVDDDGAADEVVQASAVLPRDEENEGHELGDPPQDALTNPADDLAQRHPPPPGWASGIRIPTAQAEYLLDRGPATTQAIRPQMM